MSERLSDLSLDSALADPGGALQIAAASFVRNFSAEFYLLALVPLALLCGLAVDLYLKRDLKHRYARKDHLIDLTYLLFEMFHIGQLLVIAPIVGGLTWALNTYAYWIKIDVGSIAGAAAAIAVSYLAIDFVGYWLHRWRHENPWLWQFHKVHHSTEHLTALSGPRAALLDTMLTSAILTVPTFIFASAYATPFVVVLTLFFNNLLTHANVGWSYGALDRVIVSPAFHEVHHSKKPEHIDKNYAALFAFWDHLFGTYAPRGDGPLEFGLVSEKLPENWLKQQAAPIAGLWRMAHERRRGTVKVQTTERPQ